MKQQFLSRSIALAAAIFALAQGAHAQTTGSINPSTTGTVVNSGWTQIGEVVHNLTGTSISNGTSGLLTMPIGATVAPPGYTNSWDASKTYSTATANQNLSQDGLAKASDGQPVTVTGTGVAPRASMINTTAIGSTFGMSSLDATNVNKVGGASLFVQASNTTLAGQVQDKNADGSLKFDGSGNPVMVAGTSASAYAGQIGPDNKGTAAWYGADQKLTHNSVVGAIGQNTGTGTLNLAGTHTGTANQTITGALSAPDTGNPSSSVTAVMNAQNTTGLILTTAVNGGPGTSIGQVSSVNQSKVNQTYLVGGKVVDPACTVGCVP
jgi:hypothetical protein